MVWVVPLSEQDLSTLPLTATHPTAAFGVRLALVGCDAPAADRSLYLRPGNTQRCS